MAIKTTRWDSADYLDTDNDIADYLDACSEEAPGDAALIAHAEDVIARVHKRIGSDPASTALAAPTPALPAPQKAG